jgi:chromosome segregation ATPase
MFIKYRRLSARDVATQRDMRDLQTEVDKQAQIKNELMTLKAMFNELQDKFEGIRGVNEKLKSSIAALIPEAERSKEYELLIADIEQNNKTLDNCIGSIKKENEELENTVASLESEAEGLADLLQKTVRKEELDRVLEQKQSLQLKHEEVTAELDQVRTEHENLRKSHESLQKEYKALYDNIEEEKMA